MGEFRELFPQVPSSHFVTLEEGLNLAGYAVRKFNMERPQAKNVSILTPSRFHLIHYASVGLLARTVPIEKVPYVELPRVPVDHFGIDFNRAVVMVVTYRDHTRMWPGEEILKTAQGIHDLGFTPVYVGRTGAMANWKTALAKTEFSYPGFGVDLINQTSFSELATIMGQSRCVMGLDSGPLHLALTTKAPVICGFTNVSPDLRFPSRPNCITLAVEPEVGCRFCQSDWNLDFWNFQNCPRSEQSPPCTKEMRAEKFINAFKRIVGRV